MQLIMMRRIIVFLFLVGSAAVQGQALLSRATPQAIYAESRGLFDRSLYTPAAEGFSNVLDAVDAQTDLAEQAAFFRAICAVRLLNRDAGDQVLAFLDAYPSTSRRKEAILEMAEYSFTKRRYADSRDWLRRLDGVYLPKSERAEVQFKLGYSHFLLEEYDLARPQFAAAKTTKYPIAAAAKYYYGHIAYLDTNDITALENLEPLIKDEQFGLVVPYYLAQIYARLGRDDQLLSLGEELLDKANLDRKPEIAKLIGQSLYKKKRYAEALPFLELHKSLGAALTPDDYYQLGVVYNASGKTKEAIGALNKIPTQSGEVSEFGLYLLAECYNKESMLEEALIAFKAVSEVASDPVIREESALQAAKLTYKSASPFGDAIGAFQRFLVQFPETEYRRDVNEYLANLYLTSKDYPRAMEAIVQTGLRTESMREAYQRVAYFRAVELFQEGKWPDAQEYFYKSLGYPSNLTFVALSHFWLGELSYRKGNAQEALAQFEEFLKTPGSYTLSERSDAQYNKAYCLYKLDRLKDASAAFRVYLQDAKGSERKIEDATLRLADLYFLEGKYSLAQEYYEKVIRKDPLGRHVTYAMYQEALCLGLLGKQDEKILRLSSLADKKVPNDAYGTKYIEEGQFELAQTQLRLKKNVDAEASFKAFIRMSPNSEKARKAQLNVALAQRNDGRLDAAISTLKDIVDKFPGTTESKDAIGTARGIYDELNRIDDYVSWVEGIDFAQIRASELDSVAYTSAYDKYTYGKYDDALVGFDRYLNRYPEGYFSLQAHHYAGESARRLNKLDEALLHFRKVTQFDVGDYHINAWTWIMRIASSRGDASEMLVSAESVLSLSDDPTLLREANVALMKGHQSQSHLEKALRYAEVVSADERNSSEERLQANVIFARNAFQLGLGSLANDIKGDFIAAWGEKGLNKEQRNWITESLKTYRVLKEDGPPSVRAEASYYEALVLFLDGDFTASKKEIFWMSENLSSQGRWRFKSLLILAYDYVGLEDALQANYTLDFIIKEDIVPETVTQAKYLKGLLNAPVSEATDSMGDTILETPTLP